MSKEVINKNLYESFEERLKNDNNEKYINNWKKYWWRFWKNFLISSFDDADNLYKNIKDFPSAFRSWVINKILEKENLLFVKKTTYSNLMSLFSKYHYFVIEKSKEQLNKNFSTDLQYWKEIQRKTQSEIEAVLIIPKQRQIRKDEEEIFSIDEEWNILPPKWVENVRYHSYDKQIKVKKESEENWQIKIDFDDI